MATLSIVVVSYNTRRFLERCLAAVDGRGHQVIVVDNASEDGSPVLVRERFPSVRLLVRADNAGFATAAQTGIEASTAPFILLLNADAWPAEEGAVDALLACADRDPRLAVVGPTLVDLAGREQATELGVPSRWWPGTPAVSSRPSLRLPRLRRQTFLVGAALLLRRQALEQVGGFDPDFFLFAEEIDLCLRLRRAGWRLAVCPQAVFVHVGGASSRQDWPAAYWEQVRSHLRLLAKHQGMERAERARRFLVGVLRLRALLTAGESSSVYRQASTRLASADVRTLLAPPPGDGTWPGRSGGGADRTSGGGG